MAFACTQPGKSAAHVAAHLSVLEVMSFPISPKSPTFPEKSRVLLCWAGVPYESFPCSSEKPLVIRVALALFQQCLCPGQCWFLSLSFATQSLHWCIEVSFRRRPTFSLMILRMALLGLSLHLGPGLGCERGFYLHTGDIEPVRKRTSLILCGK